jgi:hypothetical protein
MIKISEDGHIDEPGNEHYYGMGRPCPKCKKIFVTCESDLAAHLTVCKGTGLESLNWKKSDYDDSELVSVTEDPEMAKTLEHQGKVKIRDHEYFLTQNKRWIKRRKVAFF